MVGRNKGRMPAARVVLRQRINLSPAAESTTDLLSPPPITNPYAVVDERIDVDAQFALLRMNKGDAAARQDAAGMLAAVKGALGERLRLAGIYGDNVAKAAQLASRHGKYRWELIPSGEDSALILEPTDPAAEQPPTILFRGGDPTAIPTPHFGIRKQPARLDAALRKAWSTFKLLRGGQLNCALPQRDGPTTFGASIESQPLACLIPANIFPALITPLVVTPPLTPVHACPSKLVCVRHSHVARSCTNGKSFSSAASATPLTSARMNPGFLKADDLIEFDTNLDSKLVKLLVDTPKYSVMLSAESKKRRWPSGGDKIRVALVDLTGDKICNPGYAGWASTTPIPGGSTAKVAILYAAKQLLFDLNELARVGGLKTEADLKKAAAVLWTNIKCKPDLKWLVKFEPSGATVSAKASKNLETHLTQMVDANSLADSTSLASELMLRIGFEYIASLLWQSGLRHPVRQGLWFGNTYQDITIKAKANPACHAGSNPIAWIKNPFTNSGITITALSVATFFTLLAQERLVNSKVSKEMEATLSTGCNFMPSISGLTVGTTKCGRTPRLLHDAALLEGANRRYVLVVLTLRNAPNWTDSARDDFMRDIDQIVKENNP